MRRRLLLTLACLAWCGSALAQSSVNGVTQSASPPGTIQSTNAIQTCGPVTATLANAGDFISLPCPGAASFTITVVPSASGMTGTLVSTDSTTGGGRLLFKTGVGELDVNTVSFTGATTQTEYRSVGTGYGQRVTLSAVSSGMATVTILASLGPSTVFPNAPVHTTDEAAQRAGRAFTSSTGFQPVAVNSYLVQALTNPPNSGVRFVIPSDFRVIGCNNPSSALLPNFGSARNPTSGVPTTALNITKRGSASGAASVATSTGGVQTAVPATTPANPNPVGLPVFGGYPVPQGTTLEPGNTYTIWVQGVAIPSGLSTSTPSCAAIISWSEEALN